MCINDVVEYLANSRLNAIHGLQVLVDKSLISIHKDGYLMMYNLLEQLGKEIVRGQSVLKPGKRQFLVDSEEICDVLAGNTGTGTIRGIDFDLSEIRGELIIDEKAFERMSSLQFLRFRGLYNNAKLLLPQGLKFRASKLRFLQWDQCPLTFFPCEFHPQCLVKLDMPNSRLEKLWEEPIPLPCLKRMNLNHSRNLKKIPNLSNATNLEVLKAGYCSSLVEISCIGKATNLQELFLYSCPNLMAIPFSIGNATSLKTLNLGGCSSLVELPSSIGNATNVQKLNLLGCESLLELPSSIGSLKRLKTLFIVRCLKLNSCGPQSNSFPHIPANIRQLDLSFTAIEEVSPLIMSWSCLRSLQMISCKGLKVFPAVPDSIEALDFSGTGVEEIPPSIQNLSRLTKLRMVGCKKLKVLPTNINLESLSSLDLSRCTQLKTFPEISTSIEYLDLSSTAIEEVPSSIRSWFRFLELTLKDCKSLHVFHSVLDNIEELETVPLVPLRINLNGCKNLVSLPHLPDFVSFLGAANCESLERTDGFFPNPERCFNFANCFKLSQEARELIQISDCKVALLPGGELPAYFDHQASGGFLTVNLYQRPLPLFLRFKACLLLLHGLYSEDGDDNEVDHSRDAKRLSCRISCVHNGVVIGYKSCKYHLPALLGFTEHLYFFESSIPLNFPETDVNFSELNFEFKVTGEYWKIERCGVQLLVDPNVHDGYGGSYNETEYEESADIKTTKNVLAGAMRTRSYRYIMCEVDRASTRELGACVLVAFLCIRILIYSRLEKFLVLLLPLLIYGISMYQ